MNEEDTVLAQQAINYIKVNKKKLVEEFASPSIFLADESPVSVFMAGSAGAGKTEFSKRLIQILEGKDIKKIIRIDADEIREMLPGYTGRNSYIFQGACSKYVHQLHDSALRNKQNFILDGTFSNYEISYENIKRSVDKNRIVSIIYLYQDPFIAWEFTKKREILEGRNIPKESFIRQLFAAKENVNKIKKIFGKKVQVYLIENDFNIGLRKMKVNIENIDNHISIGYTKSQLESELS
jgi:predicted ABC-type ATPase